MSNKRMPVRAIVAAAFVVGAGMVPGEQSRAVAATDSADCPMANGIGYICRVSRPEDIKVIPGTRWLVSSSIAAGGGLKLIDADAKTARPFWTGAANELKADRARYSVCPGPPDPAHFATHGLSLRSSAQGLQTLYVVNHGGRETVEVFEIDSRGAAPSAVWIGCVPMPTGLAGNGVASYDDGTILTTVQLHPGRTVGEQVQGKVTGGVYQWRPGDAGFQMLPATELPGNNGIETSLDGKEFYVVGTGWNTVLAYDRSDTGKGPVRKAEAPGFMPDNLSWVTPAGGGTPSLVTAGMVRDEPACGGLRKVVNGVAEGFGCARGYVIAALNPQSMTWTILDYGEPNSAFNGVSGAVFVGDEIWLSSFLGDRLAWRPAPNKRVAGAR